MSDRVLHTTAGTERRCPGSPAHPCVALYAIVAEASGASSPAVHDWIAQHIPFLLPILPVLLGIWAIVSNWDKFEKVPGVAAVIDRVKHRPKALPKPKGDRFSIALAHLIADNASRDAERFIFSELKNFSGVEILRFDRELRDDDEKGHSRARELLERSGADVLVWGEILRLSGEENFDLYWTAREQVPLTKTYARYEPSKESLKLTIKRFADDVNDILAVLVETAIGKAEPQSNSTTSLVDRIEILGRGDRQGSPRTEALITFIRARGFGLLNLRDQEIATYDDIIQRYAQDDAVETQIIIARAFGNKGATLAELGRFNQAINIFSTITRRFGAAEDPALREQVARALYNRGVTLERLEPLDDAVTTYNELLTRFAEAPEAGIRDLVANALYNQGRTLGRLERHDDAIIIYDQLFERFMDTTKPALRAVVAWGLDEKGAALNNLRLYDDEIAVYDDVVARFGDTPELGLQVLRALYNKSHALGQLGRLNDAILIYDDVVARYGNLPDLTLREHVAGALFNKGWMLGKLARYDEAVLVYKDLIRRFGDAPELSLRIEVARALSNEGWALRQLGGLYDSIDAYSDVFVRFSDAPEFALRKVVASSLLDIGVVLSQVGRSDDAVDVFEALISRFGAAEEPELLAIAARAKQIEASAGAARNDHGADEHDDHASSSLD